MPLLLLLAVLCLIAEYWRWITAVLVLAWLVRALVRWRRAIQRERRLADERRRARARDLVRRADEQHAWTLAGDPRGTYGHYPPARECARESSSGMRLEGRRETHHGSATAPDTPAA